MKVPEDAKNLSMLLVRELLLYHNAMSIREGYIKLELFSELKAIHSDVSFLDPYEVQGSNRFTPMSVTLKKKHMFPWAKLLVYA